MMRERHAASENPLDASVAPTQAALGPKPRPFRFAAFKALEHRNFRLFFTGQLVSLVGTWMQLVAQGWLVLRLTNSPFMLGLVAFAGSLPILVIPLFAGVVVDHFDRRKLILIAQILLMLSAYVLAALTWSGAVRVGHVIALAALGGVVSSFDMPGRQAFLVEMVGREDLPNGIALNSMTYNGARTVGPAIAGIVLTVIGEAGCFFINGVSYLAVIWSLLAIEVPAREVAKVGLAMRARIREGLSYVWRHRPTFYLLLLIALTSGLAAQYQVLMPVFARDILHGGPRAYGFLLAAQGVGAVLGALAIAARPSPRELRQNLALGLFCLAFAIVGFGLSSWMPLSLAAQLLAGAGLMSYLATTNTLLQLFVSDELRGRVMSIYTISFIGMSPIGSLEVGFIGQHAGSRGAVVVSGLIALGCAVYLIGKLKLIAAAQAGGDQQL